MQPVSNNDGLVVDCGVGCEHISYEEPGRPNHKSGGDKFQCDRTSAVVRNLARLSKI